MSKSEFDSVFSGAIPEIYDRYLTPLIFDECALDLADRVRAVSGALRVLEIAAGTGVVTRALVEAVPEADLVATDLNQTMLDHAASRTVAPNLRWQQADAQDLPFEDAAFEAVVCQFGVMFFPDRVAAYREARRVLAPAGRFIFNIWDSLEANEIPLAVSDAVAEMFPDDPPDFLGRTPYGYYDLELVRSELNEAGFRDIEIAVLELISRAPSALDAALALCAGTPLRNEIEARDASRLDEAVNNAAATVAARLGSGSVDGKIRGYVFTAVSP